MSQPKIYIYRRVSSERQTKKSGLEIQVSDKTLSDLQEKYPDYSLVELANDAGLSAYHGKHLEATTALTEFIQACKSGKIPKGSILAVYSLDRLSRLKLGAAYEQVFIPIVENGVKIYSETEARIYQNDDTDYILATVLFSRAHNESKTKAKRNRDAIINAVKKWQDEKTFTANLTSAPFWIDNSTGKLNSLSESALFIVDSLIRGIGYKTISEQLQDKYPLPPQRRTSKAGTFWTIETIYKLRSNKALLGNKQVTIKDENGKQQDFTLEDYYQPLITWDTWQQLQKTKANKKRTYTDNIYLLSDLKSVLVCGECGYSMAATANRSSSNKRAKYFCGGASSKKSNHLLWKLDVETLERIVLLLINEGLEDGVKRITSPDYLRQVEEHNARLEQAETTLEDIKTRWNSTQSPTMLDLMLQQESKIKELQQKVDEHKALTDTVKNTDNLNDYYINYFKLYRQTDFTDLTNENRLIVKNELSKLLRKVQVTPDRQGWKITVDMTNGSTINYCTTQSLTHDNITIGNKYIRQELCFNGLYHYMIRVKNSYSMRLHKKIEEYISKSSSIDNIPSKSDFIDSMFANFPNQVVPENNPLREAVKHDPTWLDLSVLFEGLKKS